MVKVLIPANLRKMFSQPDPAEFCAVYHTRH